MISVIRFLKILGMGITITLILFLCSCDDHRKIAKKTNYKQAIVNAMKHSDAAFLPIKLGPYRDRYVNANPLINVLLANGWITPVNTFRIHYTMGDRSYSYFPRVIYQPTIVGKPYFKHHCDRWGIWKFCKILVKIGNAKLKTFQQFRPMQTQNGITTVDFKYSYYVEPYTWFQQLMQNPNNANKLIQQTLIPHFGSAKTPINTKIKLYFTKQGWVTDRQDN